HADFESRINVHSAILPSMVGAHTIATTSTTSNVQHSDSNLNKVITPPHVTASTTSTITTDLPIKADVKANTSETINVKTPEVPASTKLEVKDTTKLNVLQ
ncbi:MAG: hypothetical protein K0S38_683, partial [Candidatus Paceibacter sp.]|nr:hypothetical protein [Candidatus Paceibacter sp.]